MIHHLNKLRECLSQASEHGVGSSPQKVAQVILELSEQPSCKLNETVEQKELRLKRSVITLLSKELKELELATDQGDEINRYIEVNKWIIRLGRVLVSRGAA